MHTGRLLIAQLQLSAVFESHLPRILPPTLQNNNDRNKSRRLLCLIAAFPFLQLCKAPSDPTIVDVPGPLAQPPKGRGRGDAHDPRPAAGGGSGPPPAGAVSPVFFFFLPVTKSGCGEKVVGDARVTPAPMPPQLRAWHRAKS